MNILIADKFSETAIAELQAAGHSVRYDAGLKGDALIGALTDIRPNILVVRSTKVPSAALDATDALELVIRAGAGYDTIDVAHASRRGIFVANCPGKNATAVAELAFGLMIALDRQLPDNVATFRAGQWNKAGFSKASGLKGRTLGLIGFGNIAREMAPRARAFGMRVIAWSIDLTEEMAAETGVERMATALDVAAASDVISVHVASTPETRGLVGDDFFAAMREGAFIINTARGAIIDEAALLRALDTKGIRAAVDVFDGEPAGKTGEVDHPLAGHPNMYFTHHIGASTEQATAAIGTEATRVALAYAATGIVPNCVNIETHSPATHMLTVRHLDRVGVLAHVLDEVSRANWNVQEMENLVFSGAEAACARIRFDGTPNDATLARIYESENVLAVSVLKLEE